MDCLCRTARLQLFHFIFASFALCDGLLGLILSFVKFSIKKAFKQWEQKEANI